MIVSTNVDVQNLGSGLKSLLLKWGFGDLTARHIVDFSTLFVIFIISVIVYQIVKFFINRVLKRMVEKSENKWDDHLYEQKVFTRLALILPLLILQVSLSPTISDYPHAVNILNVILKLLEVGIFLLVGISFLNALYKIYGDYELASAKPIKGHIQIGKIILYIVVGIVAISVLIGQSPLTLLAGLGAMSAVLMLIFKDSLLGFVAGVQLSNNKMLQIGDWITMPKYNTDGTVLDISLVTVKVRNFDNSVSCIPTYVLITDSFQNWRSMGDAGGRRLKRQVNIDIFSICFAGEVLIGSLKAKGLYREVAMAETGAMTNLGLFRRYLYDFLKSNPLINSQSTLMVRHLPAGDTGLPIEIYAFYSPPDWVNAENTTAAIFEHIYAVLPEFGLAVFQRPSGSFTGVKANN
ncbi:MAG: mechanosensitive ion channel [Bacteroidetes bacterium]|nr:mechanosensitive ion channel [Bacteroidota bacterium]